LPLALAMPGTAFASKALDNATGLDQSFTSGYTSRAFAEDLHYQQAYGNYLQEKKVSTDWIITKVFSPSVTYDSNVTSTRNDPKDDIIYGYTGTVGVARQLKKVFISSFYTVAGTQNVEQEESNVVNHSFGQEVRYIGNRVNVSFTNSFTPSSQYSTGERTELQVDNKTKVTTVADNASLVVGYRVSPKTKVDWNLGYRLFYFPVAQTSAAVNGFSEYTITTGPQLTYQILPKTNLSAAYSFERSYFYEGGEFSSKSDTITIGTTTRVTPKISVSGSVGYTMRSYDNNVLAFNSLNLNLGGTYRLTEKVFWSLGYQSNTSEDFDALLGENKTQDNYSYVTNLSWRISGRMSANLGGSIIVTSKEGFITLPDPDNSTLAFTRELENIAYEWDASWDWTPAPYVSFKLGYRYLNQNSSFVDFEFDDQRFLGSANCRF
jgi:hypothetical protein